MDLTARETTIKEELKDEDLVTSCMSDHEVSSNGTKESWSVLGLLPPDEKSVFSYEQTISLLKEVKANWNRLSDKSVKKDDVWNEISAVVGIDKKKCNQKFRNIKDRYKKYRDSVNKGFRDLKQPTFFNEIDDILCNMDLNEGGPETNKDVNLPIAAPSVKKSTVQSLPTVFQRSAENSGLPIGNRKRKLNLYANPIKIKRDLPESTSLFTNSFKKVKPAKLLPESHYTDLNRDNHSCSTTPTTTSTNTNHHHHQNHQNMNSQTGFNLRSNIAESVSTAVQPGCSNDAFLSRGTSGTSNALSSNELFLNHLRNTGDLSLLNPLALLPGLINNQMNGLLKHANDSNNGYEQQQTDAAYGRNNNASSFASLSAQSDQRQRTPYQVEKLGLLRRLVDAVERHNDLLEKNLIQM